MFNPDNIRDIYYTEYNKLINLLKRKGPTDEKYNELIGILNFFLKNQNNLNIDELKIYKNILIMAGDILHRASPNRKRFKDEKERMQRTIYFD